jgi:hypothetical protein
MNRDATLTITSLLSIVLFVIHWADDIVRGFATGGMPGLFGVLDSEARESSTASSATPTATG